VDDSHRIQHSLTWRDEHNWWLSHPSETYAKVNKDHNPISRVEQNSVFEHNQPKIGIVIILFLVE
jgi:hypothetical protein